MSEKRLIEEMLEQTSFDVFEGTLEDIQKRFRDIAERYPGYTEIRSELIHSHWDDEKQGYAFLGSRLETDSEVARRVKVALKRKKEREAKKAALAEAQKRRELMLLRTLKAKYEG